MSLVDFEDAAEKRRAKEARAASTNPDSAAWVAKRHARERWAARLTIERVKHDNEMALMVRMKGHGLAQ